jgi:5'-nucleotidase
VPSSRRAWTTRAREILAPSAGLIIRYDLARPPGDRIVTLTLDGKPLAPDATYRVSVISFLAEGGDGFSIFTKGTERVRGSLDLEATEDWIKAVPIREVPQESRAVRLDH